MRSFQPIAAHFQLRSNPWERKASVDASITPTLITFILKAVFHSSRMSRGIRLKSTQGSTPCTIFCFSTSRHPRLLNILGRTFGEAESIRPKGAIKMAKDKGFAILIDLYIDDVLDKVLLVDQINRLSETLNSNWRIRIIGYAEEVERVHPTEGECDGK